jgi:hypothetical protein
LEKEAGRKPMSTKEYLIWIIILSSVALTLFLILRFSSMEPNRYEVYQEPVEVDVVNKYTETPMEMGVDGVPMPWVVTKAVFRHNGKLITTINANIVNAAEVGKRLKLVHEIVYTKNKNKTLDVSDYYYTEEEIKEINDNPPKRW